ncbi:DnaJ domain-containing protein [Bacillus atrophaeus]|uniref:DnaJ domain-containing protein n=1 Tax=Bacillus atrophaeus TaxID=1452 RepID=UPI00227DEB02|nr:DnaJ domain-containing protein [Bacillus atrophaeus]MCY8497779.1 DnaJ domain-containing protein [Bacillus atrophaeus]MCY8814916.1 DnaJ domain-containing protein [Bacillus atrophaeus]MCY8821538.1 DnaJ domain-containing protein [Bacillus atrophaeus]MCY8831012.1 DnaJ domain-containing protein [Bacillus atrophaeus]MCY8835227.1 DnaJ domain-containing protein [Bacillus atrophaeus]
MQFFKSVTDIKELKKQYRKLAMEFHPDRGGNEDDFILLKEEYDQLYKQLSKGSASHDSYPDVIDSLMKYNVDIEIIGTWVWVSGQTYQIKKELKELGFKWAGKKKAWFWHEGDYTKRHKKNFSLDEIREMHESEIVKKQHHPKCLKHA